MMTIVVREDCNDDEHCDDVGDLVLTVMLAMMTNMSATTRTTRDGGAPWCANQAALATSIA